MKNINYSPQLLRLNIPKPHYHYSNVLNITPVNLLQPNPPKSRHLSGMQVQNIMKNNYNEMYLPKYIPRSPTLTRNYSTPYINMNQLNLNSIYRQNSPIINNSNINYNNYNYLFTNNSNSSININNNNNFNNANNITHVNNITNFNNINNINNNKNNISLCNIMKKNNSGNIFYSPQKEINPNKELFTNLKLNRTNQHSHHLSINHNQINQNIYNNSFNNNNIIPNNNNNMIYLNQKYFVNDNRDKMIQSDKSLEQNKDLSFSAIKKESTQESTEINTQTIQSNELFINKIKYEEPKENFEPNDFLIIKRIGEGSYGKIYLVQWKKNNKKFALKKEIIKGSETLKKYKEKTKMITNFIKNTGSKGVIKVYGDLVKKKGNEYYYFVLMEMAEKDWEKELLDRQKYKRYYTEKEIFIIIKQLIKTLSLLQKNHITHRDIKPQNVLIRKGLYKISDFGEARTLVRAGIIVSRVRGTELYMSPILFNGLRHKLAQVSHNTFKSDVFSLGMCLFFACTLSLNSLCDIRELNDIKLIKEQLIKYLSKRYSFKLINILYEMLQIDENNRPDFITLEKKYFS